MKITKPIMLLAIFLLAGIITAGSVLVLANDQDLRVLDLEQEENLFIKVGGARVVFDPSREDIQLSHRLKVRQDINDLYITSPLKTGLFNLFNREKDEIIIGTAREYSLINIAAGGINISGRVSADELNFTAGGMMVDAALKAERISLNGAGVDLRGRIESKYLALNGAGMNADIEVAGIEDIELSGAGMDVEIKYLDNWKGKRSLTLDGVGSDLEILIPAANQDNESGGLDIDAGGITDVELSYY